MKKKNRNLTEAVENHFQTVDLFFLSLVYQTNVQENLQSFPPCYSNYEQKQSRNCKGKQWVTKPHFCTINFVCFRFTTFPGRKEKQFGRTKSNSPCTKLLWWKHFLCNISFLRNTLRGAYCIWENKRPGALKFQADSKPHKNEAKFRRPFGRLLLLRRRMKNRCP